MHKYRRFIGWVLLVGMLFLLIPTSASADVITDSAPVVNADSYIVVDGNTGEVLFSNNPSQKQSPASIAKIMTAYLAVESGRLDDETTVPELPDLSATNTATVHLGKGEKYPLRDLVEVMMVSSANDAAYTVACKISGSDKRFVEKMNETAAELGMKDTVFKNPMGLDEDGQVVTAKDMAILACQAMKNKDFREIVSKQTMEWKGVNYQKPLLNSNELLGMMPEATGIKTGHSEAAKHTLVASAKKDNRELIGVILGAPDETIFESMKTILNYGFEHTKNVPILQKGDLEMTLQYGDNKQVRVIVGEDYSLIQPTDNASMVSFQRKLTNVGPNIKKNSQVGVIEVLVDGEVVDEVPLIAKDEVRKPINMVFLVTLLLSVIYVASIINRCVVQVKKAKRKKEVEKQKAKQREEEAKRESYEYLNGVEHPTQPAKPQRKTLQSNRDRNRPRR